MVLPSSRSTFKVSSVILTACAKVVSFLVTKIFIPPPQQQFLLVSNNPQYLVDLGSGESMAVLKPSRIEPNFCRMTVVFNMNMRRFRPVARIEKEPITLDCKNCRLFPAVQLQYIGSKIGMQSSATVGKPRPQLEQMPDGIRPGSNKSRLMPRGSDYEYCFSNPAAGTPFESQPRFW